ncbi:MAG: hypothetical protein R2794_11450 [Chitinophagales bacterium]
MVVTGPSTRCDRLNAYYIMANSSLETQLAALLQHAADSTPGAHFILMYRTENNVERTGSNIQVSLYETR